MTKATAVQTNKRAQDIRSFLEKIVVNAGVGRAAQTPNFEEKALKDIRKDLASITGQEAENRPAKKSIAGFKMREGQVVGIRTTLRDRKMVDFFERLITIVLPRVHDFRGVNPGSVDQGGTLNIGFREQFVFPEINPEESPFTFSLGLNLVPRIKDKDEALAKFRELGMPLKTAADSKDKKKGRKR